MEANESNVESVQESKPAEPNKPKFDPAYFVKKHWQWLALIGIFLTTLYIRLIPLPKLTFIPDIDVYLFHRMVEYASTHGLQLPMIDVMKYYPSGYGGYNGYFLAFLFPAAIYMLVSKLGVSLVIFANFFPAIMGSLFVVPIYFIGKEFHSKHTGILAAFFYATCTAVLYRTSAGILEKECQAGLFMLMSVMFFIWAIKKDSLKYGILAGLSLAMFSMMWGGVIQLYIGFFIFALILFLIGDSSKALYKAYVPTVIIGMFLPSLFILPLGYGRHPLMLINLMMLGLLIVKELIQKYKPMSEQNKKYLPLGLLGAGGASILICAMFVPFLGKVVMDAAKYLTYEKSVFMTTVAENVGLSWPNFIGFLGTYSSQFYFSTPEVLLSLTSVWLLGFAGLLLLVYSIFRGKKWMLYLAMVAGLVMLFSYHQFILTLGSNFQLVFLASFFVLTFLMAREDKCAALLLIMVGVSMLGSVSRSRIIFILGPFMSVFAAYAVVRFLMYLREADFIRSRLRTQEAKNILNVALIAVIGFVVVTNFAAAHANMQQYGTGFNENWDEAMQFLREQTPEESVILSWWDYGYWFQYKGQRRTNLDGGNEMAFRNIPTAQYFTGMLSLEQQKFFLQKLGTDYIIVDASMVGKTSAMSSIANYGKKVDVYNLFQQSEIYEKNNKTIVTYGDGLIWVPVWPENGTLAGDILLATQQGDGYIRYACTGYGAVDLEPSDDKHSVDFSVLVGQGYIYLLSEELCESPNTNMIFFGGVGLDYVDRVFSNPEVQIYKVDHDVIPRETTEQLQEWWSGHTYEELLAWKPE